MAFVAQQIAGRGKARRKLPSWFSNADVVYPPGLSLEQCTSEIVARYRAGLLGRFRLDIDLTGGFGVDSRFLAERCERFIYCERNADLAAIAAENFRAFGLGDRVETVVGDGADALLRTGERFDLAFIDPARRDARRRKVSAFAECEPDVTALWAGLRERAATALVKASPGLDLSAALGALPGVAVAHVISVENECRELCLVATGADVADPEIRCADLSARREAAVFRFRLSEDASLETLVGRPERYLFEPNAAVMKGGAFKSVAARFGLRALHPRTRLYTADAVPADFPGRALEIQGQGSLNAKSARALFPDGRANVISRNSGLTADELKRKLGLKDGGELFAVGAAVAGGGRALFRCRLASG